MNIKGSTLVLMVIVCAIIMVLGVSILSITMMQYNIKRFNTEAKQSFYMAETGLNEAFSHAYYLLEEACDESLDEAEEFLIDYPDDDIGAEIVFKSSFKSYIAGNLETRVESSFNPTVETINSNLFFVGDKLIANLWSSYSTENIDRNITADIILLVPGYQAVKNDNINTADFIMFDNWSN